MEFPLEKITSSSGLDVYALHCRVLDTPVIGRIHVIPELATVIDAGGFSSIAHADIVQGFDNIRSQYGVNIKPADIRHVFLTHGHQDHVGGLSLFTHPKMVSYLHPLDLPMVSHVSDFSRQAKANLEKFFETSQIAPSMRADLRNSFCQMWVPTQEQAIGRLIQDNEQIGPFKTYHVPGHTRGQVNYQLDNLLFSGDNIMSQTITPPLWPHSFSRYLGTGNYQKGVSRMKKVITNENISVILPSHEETIYNPLKRLALIENAEKRRYKRILDYLEIGSSEMTFEERCACAPLNIQKKAWEVTSKFYVVPTIHLALINLFDATSRLEYLLERSLQTQLASA